MCLIPTAIANPTNPTVIRGQVGFSTQGNALTVSNSPGAIINWQSFSIGASETTRFIQQNSKSAVLNRITGQDPSQILGTLSSNGKVFLINPNGITFGQGSVIDVAGLVASTLDLSDADFLANRLKFDSAPGAGSVINQGAITTQAGGNVYLIAPEVENSGVITSPLGEVILAAGKSMQIVDSADPALRVEIQAEEGSARNLGQIIADSGRIGIYAGLVGNSGTISANGVSIDENGRIVLKASRSVTVDEESRIESDGVAAGSYGGEILILSVGDAEVHGELSARGDAKGGFIETSGATLNVNGLIVDTRAADGSAGLWLIDPADITIAHSTIAVGSNFSPTGASATIYDYDINAALLATNVSITTASGTGGSGNIAINGTADGGGAAIIRNSSGTARSLSIIADGSISMNPGARILGVATDGTTIGPLDVQLTATAGVINLGGNIVSYGGDVKLNGNGIILGHAVTANEGRINATSTADTTGTSNATTGGMVAIDAGTGAFVMQNGAFIGTTSQEHILDANGERTGAPAILIMAGDADISSDSTIKLNYGTGPYGGGDIMFLPTAGEFIGLGDYAGDFSLDNNELKRIFMPGGSVCANDDGCRIWVGNRYAGLDGAFVDDLPDTNQAIIAQNADFTYNGATADVGKRVQLLTNAEIDDADSTADWDIKAGALSINGGSAGMNSGGGDGLSVLTNSLSLRASAGSLYVTDYGAAGTTLALRRVEATGDATVHSSGDVYLLPYYVTASGVVGGDLTLTTPGSIVVTSTLGPDGLGGAGTGYELTRRVGTGTYTELPAIDPSIDAGTTNGTGPTSLSMQAGGSITFDGGDHSSGNGIMLDAGGDISLRDTWLSAGTVSASPLSMTAGGDIKLAGVDSGTAVRSTDTMTLTASNLYLEGGDAVNPNGTTRLGEDISGQGSGVEVVAYAGDQVISIDGSIQLQAGSSDNPSWGNDISSGSSVYFEALLGAQTISATSLELLAGAAGHDNVAALYSYGLQTIELGGEITAGSLLLQGGDGSGSYNNFAKIRSNSGQDINIHSGGSIVLLGGSGDGLTYLEDCVGMACGYGQSSNNFAAIINNSFGNAGAQNITFSNGGTLSMTGGSNGYDNFATIEQQQATFAQNISASSGELDISLTGGASGGGLVTVNDSPGGSPLLDGFGDPLQITRSNDASIYAGDIDVDNGIQSIQANDLTLTGGGSGDLSGGTIAPAIIVAADQTIEISGNLTLNGGHSNAESTLGPIGGTAFIGYDGAVQQNILVDGNLAMIAGTGTASHALIGSLTDLANSDISVAGSASLDTTAGGVPTDSWVVIGSPIDIPNGTASGSIYVGSGVTFSSGSSIMISNNDIVLGTTISALDGNAILAAGGNFINLAGSGAVYAPNGRWLIYAADPDTSDFGNLDSANTALWGANYVTLPPEDIVQSGNRYLFAIQPTVTVTPANDSKTYGDAASPHSYTVSGFSTGLAGAYLADTAETALGPTSDLLASAGDAASADVGGYVIELAAGQTAIVDGVCVYSGYLCDITLATLTVDPRSITLAANPANKLYGDPDPALSVSISGGSLGGGDSLTDVTGTLSRESGEDVGFYDVLLGVGARAGNYNISFDTDNNAFTILSTSIETETETATETIFAMSLHSINVVTPDAGESTLAIPGTNAEDDEKGSESGQQTAQNQENGEPNEENKLAACNG